MGMPNSPLLTMEDSVTVILADNHTDTDFVTEEIDQVTDMNYKVYQDEPDTDLPVSIDTIDIDTSLEHLDKVPLVPVSPWLNVDDETCMTEVNLDNIQLYLECSEDGGNSRPLALSQEPTNLMDIDGTSLIKSDVQFKISFPKFQETSKVKGFKCCCCKKIFTVERHLREHVSVAHNNEAFVCQLCMYNTKSKKLFQTHMNTKHKAVTVTSDVEVTDIIERSLNTESEAEKVTVYFIRPDDNPALINNTSSILDSELNSTTTNKSSNDIDRNLALDSYQNVNCSPEISSAHDNDSSVTLVLSTLDNDIDTTTINAAHDNDSSATIVGKSVTPLSLSHAELSTLKTNQAHGNDRSVTLVDTGITPLALSRTELSTVKTNSAHDNVSSLTLVDTSVKPLSLSCEKLSTLPKINNDSVQHMVIISDNCVDAGVLGNNISNYSTDIVESCIADQPDSEVSHLESSSSSEAIYVEPETSSDSMSNKTTNSNRYTCDVCHCGFITKSKKLLKSHHNKKHDLLRKKYTCSICQFECLQKRTFERHRIIHGGKLEFKCSVCEKCFYSKASHNRHVKIHQTDRNYHCDVAKCGKLFKTNGALTDHLKQVHERKITKGTQTCEGSETYTQKVDRKSDGISNNTSHVKKFACTFNGCNRTFRDNFNLQNHICSHNKDRKLGCKWCDFTCIQQTSLNFHYKTKHHAKKK